MKNFIIATIIILIVMFIIGACSMKASAEEINTTEDTYYEVPTDQNEQEVIEVYNISSDDIIALANQIKGQSDPVIVDTVAPVTPSNTTGFQSVIMQLLGNYSPVVIEYAYTNSNGYTSYIREVQPDYSWMISAAIFAIVLYSLFRIIGVLIND